jgi:hypothetical protein
VTTLFVADVILVLAFAWFLGAVVRPPTRPAFLLSVFVFAWADIVLTAEILSLMRLIAPWPMAAGHAALAGLGFLAWRAAGRPAPPRFSLPRLRDAVASVRSMPDVWALGLVVILAYGLLAVINILVPPNNFDGLVYHLTRVAYWLQHHSLAPWPTRSLSQTAFPLNAEIGSLWSMAFLRRDLLAGFVQWSSALAAAIAIFGLARGAGSSRPQAAFASFVFLTLPMVALQATTVQNDLTTAAMVAASVSALFVGLKTGRTGMLAVSGTAMGLALGMKLTAWMIVPGLVLGLAYLAAVRRPRPIRRLLLWAGACLAGFVLLGAFNYVQNLVTFHHPIGGGKMIDAQLSETPPGNLTLVRSNLARDLYSFMDVTGLPGPAARVAARAREAAGRAAFAALHVPPDRKPLNARGHRFDFRQPGLEASEAGSFFGPLGFLLVLPLAAYGVVAGAVRRDERLVPGLAFLGFMLVLAGTQAWIPFRGRFYCAVVALVAPLAARLFGAGPARVVLRALVALVAGLALTVTVLTNVQKPLVGPGAIWSKTRAERREALASPSLIPGRFIDRGIPSRATVATVVSYTDPEYPLFGERLTRRLVPIYPEPPVIDADWLRANPFDYVVVRVQGLSRVAPLPEDEYQVFRRPPYKLIIRKKTGS